MPKISPAARERVDRELQALTLTGAEVDQLKAKLFALTEATEMVRVGKDPAGGVIYGEAPNLHVQLAAAVRLLEFGIGKPRQQVDITNRSAGAAPPRLTRADLVSMLADDPKIAVNLIAVMQAVAGIKQVHPVQEVAAEVRSLPPESESGGSHSQEAKT